MRPGVAESSPMMMICSLVSIREPNFPVSIKKAHFVLAFLYCM
jgi:hypothetical protein